MRPGTRRLRRGLQVIRRVLFDSNAVSSLADCPYSTDIPRCLADLDVQAYLGMDVLAEIMCAGRTGIADPGRLQELLQALRRLLPILRAFPFISELIGDWSWRAIPPDFPESTRIARDIISTGDLHQGHIDFIHRQTQGLRKDLVTAGRSARATYQGSRDPTLPDPSFPQAIRDLLRKHSVLRDHREALATLAHRNGHRVTARDFRILRSPSLRYYGLGYIYLAHCAALAVNNKVIKAFPGHNDIGQLPLMPLCDAVVTDDDEFRVAAITLRDYLGHRNPWIATYAEFQAHVLTA
jgi:hypothetical protein